MPERNAPANPPVTHVCPYCGHVSAAAPPSPCPTCKMRDTPETRAATTARVGPWYLLQARNPAAPGMNFATLLSLVRRGHVTPTSVVRGPTTQQLWAHAGRVKGISREFGLCYACGQELERSSNLCPHCQRLQDPPINPDTLLEQKPPIAPPAPAPAAPPRPRPSPAAAAAAPDLGLPPGSLPALPPGGRSPERILTPRELAAAFALSPAGAAAAAGDKSSSSPAASEPAPRRPRRHPIRTALLTMVLLAACGLAAYAGVDPEFRARARDSVTRATDWARAHLSETPAPPPARPVPAAAERRSSSDDARRVPIQAAAFRQPAPATPPPPKVQVDVGPPSQPAVAAPPAALPAATPRPAAPVPKPPAEATAAQTRQSIDLYRAALQAESDSDYAAAVRLYEQIRQLPRSTWPESLERRLAAAKLRTGAGD